MPEFVALAQWLAAPTPVVADMPEVVEEEVFIEPSSVDDAFDNVDAALTDARRFRAVLAEAVEMRARQIAREIAIEVLARELELAPCDLKGIIERACVRYHVREALEIRVHPDDIAALIGFQSVVPDPALRRGDALLTASCGTIDASLGARLDRVLRAIP